MKKLAFILTLAFLVSNLCAQELIPQPKKIVYGDDAFSLNGNIFISEYNVSESLLKDMVSTLENHDISISISNVNSDRISNIVLKQFDSQHMLDKALRAYDFEDKYNVGDEGYILGISPTNMFLFSLTEAGSYYAIQTLNQILKIHAPNRSVPSMTICDKPDIAIRAWQDDISRGPIPTMEVLKEQIRVMSSYKLNYFTLYTEHVYKLKKHPTIAPEDGITKEQLKELSEYAKKHFVTLIGNYQSFGHMEETLANPAYSHLGENGHIISPALDESYEFLNDVYEEIVPQYSGAYFNINCDETFGLGEGKSKAMVDSIGISGVYVNHINKLDGLLKKYNKKILMWGDIATSHPEIVPSLPKDMTVIVWGYHSAPEFDYAITPISNQNLNFWVAPGVNCWSNVFPDMHSTEINVYNFIRDGYKLNAAGVLNTSWDDDGINFFNYNWHGLAWGAENSWNAPPNLSKEDSERHRADRYSAFNRAFDAQYFGIKNEGQSISNLMVDFSFLHQADFRKALKNSRFFEPIFPMHYDYIQDGEMEKNLELLSHIDSLIVQYNETKDQVKFNKSKLDYFLFAMKQAQLMLKKNIFRINLYRYINGFSGDTKEDLKSQKHTLYEDLLELKEEYISLWNRENRNYWLEVNEKLFDKIINSINVIDGYVMIDPTNEINDLGRKIKLRSVFGDYPIYYSINEDSVSELSTAYSEPFYINQDAHIQATSYLPTIPFSIQNMDLKHHKVVGKLYKLHSEYSQYHPSYDGGGQGALIDGRIGSPELLRDGRWQGFSGQDIDIELKVDKDKVLNSFSMGFYQHVDLWVIFPKQVEIYTKQNLNDDYSLFKIIKGTVAPEKKGAMREVYSTALGGIKADYIKVIARYYGKLPEWHHAGSEYESMIFADEIIIE